MHFNTTVYSETGYRCSPACNIQEILYNIMLYTTKQTLYLVQPLTQFL